MKLPPQGEHTRAWSRGLGVQARRAWLLLNGRSPEERDDDDDDDDDDDMPRPNAVMTSIFWFRVPNKTPALA